MLPRSFIFVLICSLWYVKFKTLKVLFKIELSDYTPTSSRIDMDEQVARLNTVYTVDNIRPFRILFTYG